MRILIGAVMLMVVGFSCVHEKPKVVDVADPKDIYFLKHSLYRHKDAISRVYPDRIENLVEDCNDTVMYFLYESLVDVMYRGDEVRIVKVRDKGDAILVAFRHRRGQAGTHLDVPFECLLMKDRSRSAIESFNLLFSREQVGPRPDKIGSIYEFELAEDIVLEMDYPVSICRDGEKEIWHYNFVYTQHNPDQLWFTIKDGQVVDVEWSN